MKNIESINVELSNFSNKVINNLIEAQKETAQQVLEDVKKLAPIRTGAYKNSIQISDTTYKDDVIKTSIFTNATVIDSKGKSYNLGKLIEFGTRPHEIKPVHAQYLRFEIDGKVIYASHVFHPGTTANPHFQMALQKNISLYHQNISKAIKEANK